MKDMAYDFVFPKASLVKLSSHVTSINDSPAFISPQIIEISRQIFLLHLFLVYLFQHEKSEIGSKSEHTKISHLNSSNLGPEKTLLYFMSFNCCETSS